MKRDTQKPMSRVGRGGFTLVELMIAVGIIAILAAFLAPNVSTYMQRNKGQTAARNVSNMFQMARNRAMSRGEAILATVNKHSGNDNGSIVLSRTHDPDLAECQPGNANFDPSNPDCYALSCVQTGGFKEQEVARLDLSKESPDMIIAGMDTTDAAAATDRGVTSETLCFSPSGRVLNQTGTTFTSDCEAVNTRIFIAMAEPGTSDSDVMTNPLTGGKALDGCLTAADDEAAKQKQKDGRDINNFFSIHVPYNGAVSIVQ